MTGSCSVAEKPEHVLNIQPVLPFSLNSDWNMVTPTIVPIVSQPAFSAGQDHETGLGDVQFSTLFVYGGLVVQLMFPK